MRNTPRLNLIVTTKHIYVYMEQTDEFINYTQMTKHIHTVQCCSGHITFVVI